MKNLIVQNSDLSNTKPLDSINEIASTTARAASTIAKHTDTDEKTAILLGVGSSFLITAMINLLK